MTVFPFPPDFPKISAPFSIVGFDWKTGSPEGELLITPDGSVPSGFRGPVWSSVPCPDRPGLLYPPEAAPEARPVAFPSFVPPHSLRAHWSAAKMRFGSRLWLQLMPLSHLFVLPCPDGAGTPVPPQELARICSVHPSYFCPEFVCQCAHWPDDGQICVLLFDTDETISMKLSLAAALGIPSVFGRF